MNVHLYKINYLWWRGDRTGTTLESRDCFVSAISMKSALEYFDRVYDGITVEKIRSITMIDDFHETK